MARGVRIGGPARRMTTRDAGFLYLERSDSLLHIGCVAVLAGAPSRGELIGRVAARLPRMRRYAQRAVPVPFSLGHPTWEDDPGFDVGAHVRRWAVPAPGGEAELVDLVRALLEQPLDRARPLWEMHLLEGLDGGRSAVFQKVHHCMVDGVSGAQLLEVLLDPAPGPFEPLGALPRAPALPPATRRMGSAVADGARTALREAGGAVGALLRPAAARRSVERLRRGAFAAVQLATRDVPEMPWNAPIGPGRRLAFTRLPLEAVGRVRRVRGGTVNDVVLSILAGGLRRYLDAQGVPTRGLELTAMVPVSLRDPGDAASLGNRISGMLVPLAVDPPEEVPRLAATRAITERLKAGAAWTGIDSLLEALEGAPPPLVALAGRSLRVGRLANLVATNVPGPRETRWLGPHRVEALQPIVPIAGEIGLGVAVFSYDGWLHVGVNGDAAHVPDPEKLSRGIEDAFAALLAGAGA